MSDTQQNFNTLRVWQSAHGLILQLHSLVKEFPKDEQYGITSQLKRSAIAVTSYLAEGYGRYYYKDKIRSYMQAKSAIAEIQNLLLIIRDLNLVEEATASSMFEEYDGINRGISVLISKTGKKNEEKVGEKEAQASVPN